MLTHGRSHTAVGSHLDLLGRRGENRQGPLPRSGNIAHGRITLARDAQMFGGRRQRSRAPAQNVSGGGRPVGRFLPTGRSATADGGPWGSRPRSGRRNRRSATADPPPLAGGRGPEVPRSPSTGRPLEAGTPRDDGKAMNRTGTGTTLGVSRGAGLDPWQQPQDRFATKLLNILRLEKRSWGASHF